MTQDLRSKDQAAQDRIETLESQLAAADIENEEHEQTIKSLLVQLRQFYADRTYCPWESRYFLIKTIACAYRYVLQIQHVGGLGHT